jgi:HlyD family secretion protein
MQSDRLASRNWRWARVAKWLIAVALVTTAVYLAKFRSLPVIGHEVTKGALFSEVMGTGTLEARVKTTISPRLQERLAEVLVDQNDAVQAGQLLARLDDGELRQQVEVAEAGLAAARATVERVKVDEARAEAVVQQARLDHQRVAELLATRVSSAADLDKAAEQLSVAGADLRRAQAASREAESQVVTAEKTLAYQRERLAFTRIVSPYDGLVVRRDRDPGGVVVPGSSLLQLISTNELWISAWVDETAMASLATGQLARVVFRSEPAREYPGRVARLGREADRETREFLVDVRVDELPANWAVGQRAEVFIETGRKTDVLTLPQPFVQWREGRPGVLVHERGRAAWRPVSLGGRGRGVVEVTQGLSPGDQVIRPPDARQTLRAGGRVRLTEPGRAGSRALSFGHESGPPRTNATANERE